MTTLGPFVGARVKAFRKALKLSQDELALLADCEKMTISRYERGVSTPNLDHLIKLAIALNISPSELLPPDEFATTREQLPKLREEITNKILLINSVDGLKDIMRLTDWILAAQQDSSVN